MILISSLVSYCTFWSYLKSESLYFLIYKVGTIIPTIFYVAHIVYSNCFLNVNSFVEKCKTVIIWKKWIKGERHRLSFTCLRKPPAFQEGWPYIVMIALWGAPNCGTWIWPLSGRTRLPRTLRAPRIWICPLSLDLHWWCPFFKKKEMRKSNTQCRIFKSHEILKC